MCRFLELHCAVLCVHACVRGGMCFGCARSFLHRLVDDQHGDRRGGVGLSAWDPGSHRTEWAILQKYVPFLNGSFGRILLSRTILNLSRTSFIH